MAEQGSSVGRWVAGIAGTIIAGVLLALILGWINGDDDSGGSGSGGTPATNTSDTPVLPDVLTGDWSQSSWNEADRGGVTLGMEPRGAQLSVSADGSATWTVAIDDLFQDEPAQTPAVRCSGRVSLAAMMDDTSVAETINYTSNMESLRTDIGAAFCGDDGNPFSLQWSPDASATTLEMRNDFGVYTWQR